MKNRDERLFTVASIAQETSRKLAEADEHFVALLTIDSTGMPFVSKHEQVDNETFIEFLEKIIESIHMGRAKVFEEPKVN